MLVVGWKDKQVRPMILVSTVCSSKTIRVNRRDPNRPAVDKPVVVHQYNQSMNRVDKADQYSVNYRFQCRSVKWWRKMFFWLLEVSVVNSYLLYEQMESTHLPHLDFRWRVVEGLLEGLPLGLQYRQVIRAAPAHQHFQGRHYLEKGQSHSLCIVCKDMRRRQRHDTVFLL